MLLRIHHDHPNPKNIKQLVDCLKNDGVIIYPTDTVYGIACDMNSKKAFERIAMIKGIKPEKANFSFVCRDLSEVSKYSLSVNKQVYRLLKEVLPGPYTFILRASAEVPKLTKGKKNEIGIRIPDDKIAMTIVESLGNPIITTSLFSQTQIDAGEYYTDPSLIHEEYGKLVDVVVDGGVVVNNVSTILDCTSGEVEIIRQGSGPIEDYL